MALFQTASRYSSSDVIGAFVGGFLCCGSFIATTYYINKFVSDPGGLKTSREKNLEYYWANPPPSKSVSSTSTIRQFVENYAKEEEELKREQLSRNTSFFGEPGQRVLERSYVIVVGLGGVGSHAAHLLARCGVKKLKLIDFDQVTLSSLNRHAVAVREDVGTSKAECLKKYINKFAPWCEVAAETEMFTKQKAHLLMFGVI